MSDVHAPAFFLDANASMPPLPAARAALAAAADVMGNPSSTHTLGRRARRVLDEARDAVAGGMRAQPSEVFFTSGATEGNRLAIDMLCAGARTAQRPFVVVTTPLEHPAVRRVLEQACALGLLQLRVAPLSSDGAPQWPAELVGDVDAAVVTAAHNETGIVPDLDALAARLPGHAVLVVDAAQSAARLPPPLARADVVVVSGHKLGGYAGSGALVVRGRARTLPLPWAGGGQEQGLRPGTESLVLVAALGAAAGALDDTRAAHASLVGLRDRVETRLVDVASVLGARTRRLPQTSALLCHDVAEHGAAESLRLALDADGVAGGVGGAGGGLAPAPSPSLLALGLSATQARATIRLSLAPGIDASSLDAAADRIRTVVAGVLARRRARSAPV